MTDSASEIAPKTNLFIYTLQNYLMHSSTEATNHNILQIKYTNEKNGL